MTQSKQSAQIKKWKTEYHEDTDTLFVTKDVIPKDAVKFQTKSGYAVYLTPKGKIVGIMIEYFMTEASEIIKKFKPQFFI